VLELAADTLGLAASLGLRLRLWPLLSEWRRGKGEEAETLEPIEPGERKPIYAWCKCWSEREAA
jgi:hypothetical protein